MAVNIAHGPWWWPVCGAGDKPSCSASNLRPIAVLVLKRTPAPANPQVGNLFEGNLGFHTLVSNALLNTDTTPASFWITNPNNTYRNNVAAGGPRCAAAPLDAPLHACQVSTLHACQAAKAMHTHASLPTHPPTHPHTVPTS
jgi:hypothetical protein